MEILRIKLATSSEAFGARGIQRPCYYNKKSQEIFHLITPTNGKLYIKLFTAYLKPLIKLWRLLTIGHFVVYLTMLPLSEAIASNLG
jgi:hypothetical protein